MLNFEHFSLQHLGLPSFELQALIEAWLKEDLGRGDIAALCQEMTPIKAVIIAKQSFVICGLSLMAQIFQKCDSQTRVFSGFKDGDFIEKGQIVLEVEGISSALLMAERTALNIASHLSGISTKTRRMVQILKKNSSLGKTMLRILETRKTTPGLRILEKYATRVGGALNHRHGLDAGLMLKENHLRALGGITRAVQKSREVSPLLTRIEVEVTNFEEFKEALDCQVDVIMLDHFNNDQIKEAVILRNERKSFTLLEASGNVDEERILSLISTGIDFISSGALIHQSQWVDMSMQVIEEPK